MTTGSSSPPAARPRPSGRACDRCRRRKAKCDFIDSGDICINCRDVGGQCKFDLPLGRRGPKTRRSRAEAAGNNHAILSPIADPVPSTGPPASGFAGPSVVVPAAIATSPPGLALRNSAASSSKWEPAQAASVDHLLSPQTVRSSISEPEGRYSISALQRWHILSRELALCGAAPAVNLEQIIKRCFDLFFEYLYPLTPLVHEPSLRNALAFFVARASEPASHNRMEVARGGSTVESDAWTGFSQTSNPTGDGGLIDRARSMEYPELWREADFTLITAVCAEAAFMLPKDLLPEGESIAETFLTTSRSCLNSYLEADLENPNANSITIRYLHSNCLHAAGKSKYSWHIFGEATRLAQVMKLHEESSLEGLFPIEAELRRRAFWIVYMGDKSAAILNNRPITIHKFSFECGITTAYPTGIEDDVSTGQSPGDTATEGARKSFIVGFNANLRLWQAASDLLLEIRLLQDQRKDLALPGQQPMLTTEDRSRLDSLYVGLITCLDDLPLYLQSYTFGGIASGGKEATHAKQFIIQCANLQVSLHCLRMVITQKFEDLSYFAPGVEQADLRKTEIARDMLRVMHEAPFWSLQVNGEPYVEKIRLIGASLLAIIHRNGTSPLAARARSDFTVLLDILTRLDSKASDMLRSGSSWVA